MYVCVWLYGCMLSPLFSPHCGDLGDKPNHPTSTWATRGSRGVSRHVSHTHLYFGGGVIIIIFLRHPPNQKNLSSSLFFATSTDQKIFHHHYFFTLSYGFLKTVGGRVRTLEHFAHCICWWPGEDPRLFPTYACTSGTLICTYNHYFFAAPKKVRLNHYFFAASTDKKSLVAGWGP